MDRGKRKGRMGMRMRTMVKGGVDGAQGRKACAAHERREFAHERSRRCDCALHKRKSSARDVFHPQFILMGSMNNPNGGDGNSSTGCSVEMSAV